MPRTKDGGWILDDEEIQPLTKEELEGEEEREVEMPK